MNDPWGSHDDWPWRALPTASAWSLRAVTAVMGVQASSVIHAWSVARLMAAAGALAAVCTSVPVNMSATLPWGSTLSAQVPAHTGAGAR